MSEGYTSPSVDDVRVALNEISATELPDTTIKQAIRDANRMVADELSGISNDDIDPDDRAFAVREWAAYRAWNSAPRKHRQSALDTNTTWDVQQFTKRLERRKDAAVQDLTDSTPGGGSAGFFMTSRSVFDTQADR